MAKTDPIGTSLPRADGMDKVTGKSIYGDDIMLPGQLYGAVHRSEHPHARILAVHTEAAAAYPGVRAVITGETCRKYFGQFIADQPILAIGKVRYWGEPVAAVAADDPHTAHEAAKLIKVDYAPLPVVDTIEKALKGDTLLHEDWKHYTIYGATHPVPNSNIVDRFVLSAGNLEDGFSQADVVVENEFYCGMLQHTVMETHCATAVADTEKIHVYSPAQSPFAIRGVIANAFGYSQDNVRITCTEIGGGFGCKAEAKAEPIAVALALASKRPVKLLYERHEEFAATLVRAPVLFKIKTGAKKDGTLVAQQIKIYWDTGAYGTFGPRVNYNAGYAANGPYKVPNTYVDGYCLVTNKTLGTAYRGFGITEVANAHEMQMDCVAEQLHMDPLELRLKNVLRDGDISVTGERMQSVGVAECLEKAAQSIDWANKPLAWKTPDGKLRGKGIACYIKLSGTPSTTSCILRMNEDGTLTLLSGSREMGQGVMTVLPQIAAAALSMDPGRIKMAPVDTAFTPYDKTTTSSRSTFHSGKAVLEAAEGIKRQLCALAAKKWGVPVEAVAFQDGLICHPTDPSRSISISNVKASGIMKEQPPVIATGAYGTSDIFDTPDPETHASKRPTIMWMMGAQAAEVEVDPGTGRVRVIKIGAAHDVGKAVNPLGCLQQIEGALVMGVGHALLEEMIYQDGILKNGNMVDYKVPTFMDADFETEISLVECAHPEGPFGLKGIGEPGVAPTAPAIANAVSAACGRRFRSTPIKPEQILLEKGGSEHAAGV